MRFKLVETLNEKWYKDCSAPVWWSDSEYEFRNFIKNLVAT